MLRAKSPEVNEAAAKNGSPNKIKNLAALGANVNALLLRDRGLRAAAIKGQVDIVRYLLDNGCCSERDKEEALVMSSYHCKIDVMKLLMEHGVFDPEAIGCAIKNGHLKAMKYLLDFDSRYLHVESRQGYTILQCAVYSNNLLATRELLERYKIDPCKTGKAKNTAWALAIEGNRDISMLQLLLRHGSDINQVIHRPPVERAIHYVLDMRKTLEVAEFLVSTGADMHMRDSLDNTLLHFLLRPKMQIGSAEDFMKKVQFLVESGVDYKAGNAHGQQAKSLLTEESAITGEQFDISVEAALNTLQKNKRMISLTIQIAFLSAGLQLPNTLTVLIADYVGSYCRAFKAIHLLSLDFVVNNTKPLTQTTLDENKEDEEQDSASSSNAPTSSPGGNGMKASSSSVEQPSDQQQASGSESNKERSTNYKEVVAVEEPAEALLSKLFSWIKDLPEELQQQLLLSSSMQSVLELLETFVQPNKPITDQLSTKAIEESFLIEYQNYYGQDALYHTTAQAEAQVNQYDLLIDLNEEAGVIFSNGMLIDHLPKHDINFGAPCSLDGLANF